MVENDKNVLPWTGERYVPHVKGNIQLEHVHRYALAREYVKDKVVLDIACGEGYGSAMLCDFAAQVFGVDISEDAITHAQKTYRKNNLQFKMGSCSNIPLTDHIIDRVISFETIEHHDQHEAMMTEIKRVLKPGGLLIISSPDKHTYSELPGYDNPYHKKELYYHEFKKLLEANFKRIAIYGQRIIFGSGIFPEQGQSLTVTYSLKEIETANEQSSLTGIYQPVYLIAIASDSELPAPLGGILEQPIKETELFCELVDQRSKIQQLDNLLAQERQARVSSDSIKTKLQQNITSLNSVIIKKEREIRRYQNELYGVYISRSWRLTKPLRICGRLVRKIFDIPHKPRIRKIIKALYFLIPARIRMSGTIESLKDRFKSKETIVY